MTVAPMATKPESDPSKVKKADCFNICCENEKNPQGSILVWKVQIAQTAAVSAALI